MSLSSSDNLYAGASLKNEQCTYLAQANSHCNHVDCPSEYGNVNHTFDGNCDEYVTSFQNNPNIIRQLKNKVRKCLECGKPCAFTLTVCNACGNDISETEVTYTNNIFMSFVFGIKTFKIAMRYQDENYMVFDDLLCLTNCHLNTIPTSVYIPDWRYLLTRPQEGLTIINTMYNNCFQVVKNQFWQNENWRTHTIRGESKTMSDDEIKSLIAAGFNYPPSQYQLHLQFMVLPLTPFHYGAYLKGHHYTKGRFVPFEYAKAVLELGISYNVTETTSLTDIFEFYETKGVSYDSIFDAQYQRYDDAHNRAANYEEKDFGGKVINDEFYSKHETTADSKVAVKALNSADKDALSNYGRPVDVSGEKPVYFGTFYRHAKTDPSSLDDWTAPAAL